MKVLGPVTRWLGFLRLVHGAPPSPLVLAREERRARLRELAQDALLPHPEHTGALARPRS